MSAKSAASFLEESLKFYTPSRCEMAFADFLAEKMRSELSYKNVKIDKVGNVSGEIGNGRPAVLLCGHTDTVPGDLPVNHRNNTIYGRGAVDAKSSLVAMILAASRLAENKTVGKITVAGVVDEEGSGLGIKELLMRDLEIDYAVFGEPSGSGNVTIGYKGRIGLKISFKTMSVHASAPWLSPNAVEKMFELWKRIKDYVEKRQVADNRYQSPSASLTKISGGSADNVTAGECEMTVDVRVPPRSSCAAILHDLDEIMNLFKGDPSLKIVLNIADRTEPFETNKNSNLVRAVTRRILEVKGKRPLLLRKTGTGDMNILGHSLKCPVITYGPGNPRLSHTEREFIEVEEYLSSIEVYEKTILNLTRFKLKS